MVSTYKITIKDRFLPSIVDKTLFLIKNGTYNLICKIEGVIIQLII